MNWTFLLAVAWLSALTATNQPKPTPVPTIKGKMSAVMRQGKLGPVISTDTLNQKNLYGFGPMAYLKGELLVLDGKVYQSTVINKKQMEVKEVGKATAPFFGYAHIAGWKQVVMPDSISDLITLENHLNQTLGATNPNYKTFFKLKVKAKEAIIHLVNLPKGTKVSSPEQAHKGLVQYPISNQEVEILGFYSQQHQTIFTHHDTNLHLHLISADRLTMGHLETITFEPKKVQLFLPE
jgi:acetolactate decarboxylase